GRGRRLGDGGLEQGAREVVASVGRVGTADLRATIPHPRPRDDRADARTPVLERNEPEPVRAPLLARREEDDVDVPFELSRLARYALEVGVERGLIEAVDLRGGARSPAGEERVPAGSVDHEPR